MNRRNFIKDSIISTIGISTIEFQSSKNTEKLIDYSKKSYEECLDESRKLVKKFFPNLIPCPDARPWGEPAVYIESHQITEMFYSCDKIEVQIARGMRRLSDEWFIGFNCEDGGIDIRYMVPSPRECCYGSCAPYHLEEMRGWIQRKHNDIWFEEHPWWKKRLDRIKTLCTKPIDRSVPRKHFDENLNVVDSKTGEIIYDKWQMKDGKFVPQYCNYKNLV